MIEGLHTTTYLLNGLPTETISMTSPYFTPHGVAPSYEHLRVFDCAHYPKPLTNWHPSPPDVFFLDIFLIIKVTGVLISPPTTSSSPNTLF
jgi:hypothetical protein